MGAHRCLTDRRPPYVRESSRRPSESCGRPGNPASRPPGQRLLDAKRLRVRGGLVVDLAVVSLADRQQAGQKTGLCAAGKPSFGRVDGHLFPHRDARSHRCGGGRSRPGKGGPIGEIQPSDRTLDPDALERDRDPPPTGVVDRFHDHVRARRNADRIVRAGPQHGRPDLIVAERHCFERHRRATLMARQPQQPPPDTDRPERRMPASLTNPKLLMIRGATTTIQRSDSTIFPPNAPAASCSIQRA